MRSAFGLITVTVDGKASLTNARPPATPPAGGFGGRTPPNAVNLNPIGQGGDYLAFGLLCEIGFAVEAGQTARFRNVTVRHTRAPHNVLFREDLERTPYAASTPARWRRLQVSLSRRGTTSFRVVPTARSSSATRAAMPRRCCGPRSRQASASRRHGSTSRRVGSTSSSSTARGSATTTTTPVSRSTTSPTCIRRTTSRRSSARDAMPSARCWPRDGGAGS